MARFRKQIESGVFFRLRVGRHECLQSLRYWKKEVGYHRIGWELLKSEMRRSFGNERHYVECPG